jgi:exodeoxyribonuclease-5
MIKDQFIHIIRELSPDGLTDDQLKLIDILGEFTLNKVENELLVIKGYAGTGKTTMISAYIKTLSNLKIKTVLLAPTGRAAKVLAGYSEHLVSTIHKKIYRQKSSKDAFGEFARDKNLHGNTFFIVDEASLISDHQQDISVFGSGNLLKDLINYVYNDRNCKLVLVGDTAQLPPVGFSESHSLNKSHLETYTLSVIEHELREVVRQVKDSGILTNASALRNLIINGDLTHPRFRCKGFPDITRIAGNQLLEYIADSYSKYGKDETIVICRSNKIANKYNQGIRSNILSREEELSAGDFLMVVKNNYHWLAENEKADFIANGDIIKVKRVKKYEELYGFRFAVADIILPDYDDLELSVKLLMNTINSQSPALSPEDNKKLFYSVAEDYPEIRPQSKRYALVKENDYFNALQVKFAYAVTCHKSQGGQWKVVFIDQSFFHDDMLTPEYLKWLYTAITRATEKVCLVNFADSFFI